MLRLGSIVQKMEVLCCKKIMLLQFCISSYCKFNNYLTLNRTEYEIFTIDFTFLTPKKLLKCVNCIMFAIVIVHKT